MLLNWDREKQSFAIKAQFLIIGYLVGDTGGSKNSGRAVRENCSTCYSLLSLLFTYEKCDVEQCWSLLKVLIAAVYIFAFW